MPVLLYDIPGRTGATIASLLGAPAVFVANADDDPEQLHNTGLRLVAAAPMSPSVDAVYRDRFGVATFSAGYGLTEVSLISMLAPGEANRPGAAGVDACSRLSRVTRC